jgi:hypothetical protein
MNTVLRRAAVAPVRIMQRRNAGGHHGPAPTYTGVEAKIRKFLPRDSHVREIFVLEFYDLHAEANGLCVVLGHLSIFYKSIHVNYVGCMILTVPLFFFYYFLC